MYNIVLKVLSSVVLLNLSFCTNIHKENRITMESFPYKINEPDNVYKLPAKLAEISGIAFHAKDNVIACHNDEKGMVYFYDLVAQKISDELEFAQEGDFEDIAFADNGFYVLRSDGYLFHILKSGQNDHNVYKYTTPLNEKNDTEGLCYDNKDNSLLIACKGKAGIGKNKLKDTIAIYKYDISSHQLLEDPFIAINIEDIKEFIKLNKIEEIAHEVGKALDENSKDPVFRPSAIALHPISDEIYILASVGKKIVVTDRNGKINAVVNLDKQLFPQPEGISFKPNGDMFISNESEIGSPNILEFRYISKP